MAVANRINRMQSSNAMNWMTSAKNRINRSKSKHNDNLRMVASSKLPNRSSEVNDFSLPNKQKRNGFTQRNRTSEAALASRDSKSYGDVWFAHEDSNHFVQPC